MTTPGASQTDNRQNIRPGQPGPASSVSDADENLSHSTILIVDDNPQNVELLQAYLEVLPCKILTAFDGVEAMGLFESPHRQYPIWCCWTS